MSNSNKVHGIIKIEPPFNFAEIRKFEEALTKKLGRYTTVLALSRTSTPTDTDEGTFTKITSNMAEVYGEGEYGVVEFLQVLATFGKNHTFTGEITVVDEDAEYIDYNSKNEARQYSIRGVKLCQAFPIITWGPAEEVK